MRKLLIILAVVLSCRIAQAQSEGPAVEKTIEEKSIQVAKDFFNAYLDHNHDKVSKLLHPDIVWNQPGDNRISGIKRSRKEVLQMGAMMSELSAKTVRLTDVKIMGTNGNVVACLLHWKAVQPTGNVLDIDNIDIYTIENGKVVSAVIYSENIEKENAFWGK